MRSTLRILRYDPEADQKPHWEEYTVEVEPTDRLLDALQQGQVEPGRQPVVPLARVRPRHLWI